MSDGLPSPSRKRTSLSGRVWLRGLAIIFGLLAFLAVVAAFMLRSMSPLSRCHYERTFSRKVWSDSAATYGSRHARGCMVDDLLRRYDMHGWTRAEVVGLIGEPPKTDYFSEYDLVYWLGPERGLLSIDSEWLVFRLDTQGRVSEYRLVTD
jgi:hypothetical protein